MLRLQDLAPRLPQGVWHRFLRQAKRRRLHPLVRDRLTLALLDADLQAGRYARAAGHRQTLGLVETPYIIGPFDNDGGIGFQKRYPPELQAGNPILKDRAYVGKTTVVRWRLLPRIFNDGRLRLGAVQRPNVSTVSYLRIDLEAKRPTIAALRLGTNCAYRVWLRGKLVFSRSVRRPFRADQDALGLKLQRGRNALLVKVAATDVSPEIMLRLTAPKGGPLRGVLQRLPPRVSRGSGLTVIARLGLPVGGPPVTDPRAVLATLSKRRPTDALLSADLIRYLLAVSPDDPRQETALGLAQQLVKDHPSAVAYRLLALASRAGNDQRRALESALKHTPRDALALDGLGDFFFSAGRRHLAEQLWQRALKAEPGLVPVALKLAEMHRLRRMPALARQALAALMKKWPRSDDVRSAVASLDAERGRIAQAASALSQLAARHQNDLSVLIQLTSLEQRRLRPKAAARWIRMQIRARPDRLQPKIELARTLAANGNPRAALGLLGAAVRVVPRAFVLHEALGRTALGANLVSKAKTHFGRALQLRPQALKVKRLLAYLDRRGPDPLVHRYAKSARRIARAAWALRTPKADAQVLLDVTAYKVMPSGLSQRFQQRIIQINTLKGVASHRSHRLDYLPDTQHVEVLAARIIRPDGSEQEAQQSDVQMMDPAVRMYYDRRLKVIHFASLHPGDVIELQTLLADIPASNMFKDYFGTIHPLQSTAPIRELRLTIELPPGRRIGFNKPALAGLVHRATRSPSGTVHSWVVGNVPDVQSEPQMPGWTESFAHLHISTFRTWKEVARWYWGLVKEQYHSDAAIRAAAHQAAKGARTLREKVAAVYNLVVKKTRYVALAFGIHTYKPYSATQVFARKFGDCKDKAMLITVMLKELGVRAYPVLIRTSPGGKVATQPPSLAPFDHAIVYVPALKLFLDGTAERTGSGELPYADQGMLALIIDGGDGQLVVTPVLPAQSNRIQRSLDIAVQSDGTANISEAWTIRGQTASWWRTRFVDPALRKERFEKLINATFPRARVERFTISDPDDLEQPVTVKATYQVPAFARKQGAELMTDLSLGTAFTNQYAPLSSRKHPVVYAYPWAQDVTLRVRWPAGYAVQTKPRSAQISALGGALSFHQRVSQAPRALTIVRRLRVARHRYRASDYPALRGFWLGTDRFAGDRLVLGQSGRRP